MSNIVVLFLILPSIRPRSISADFLKKLPECNGKVGAVGHCLGGKLCYLMCCRTDIDCAVDYYGTYIEHNIREAKNLHRPFVLHMAMKDRWVQAEVNELLERRLSPNPLVTIHKYPGADHAFPRRGGKDLQQAGSGSRAGADARFLPRTSPLGSRPRLEFDRSEPSGQTLRPDDMNTVVVAAVLRRLQKAIRRRKYR
jgi:hypothetical protein